MKVSWRNFPSNRGHRQAPAVSAATTKHVSEDGWCCPGLRSRCPAEHQVSGQNGDKSAMLRMLKYPHPVDIGESYLTMNCSDCHGTTGS
jgi:hypothetical protein